MPIYISPATTKMAESRRSKDQNPLSGSTAYLILYNFVLFIGWSALLYCLVLHLVLEKSSDGVYSAVEWLLKIFQTAAIMEVVHAATGLVRSSPVLTGFQVSSRLFLTWAVAHNVPQVQNSVGVTLFLVAWAVTEVVRYSYYVFGLIERVPYFLTWCRYTFFIVLYPIGITGELLTIYGSLPYVKKSSMYSVSMPNPANMSFSFYYFLIIVMFAYIPIFPQLYSHMFRQRKKFLGTPRPKTE